MSNVRVHELAKELNVPSKDVLEKLGRLGLDGKSHMSSLDPEVAEQVRALYRPVEVVEHRVASGLIRRRAKMPEIVPLGTERLAALRKVAGVPGVPAAPAQAEVPREAAPEPPSLPAAAMEAPAAVAAAPEVQVPGGVEAPGPVVAPPLAAAPAGAAVAAAEAPVRREAEPAVRMAIVPPAVEPSPFEERRADRRDLGRRDAAAERRERVFRPAPPFRPRKRPALTVVPPPRVEPTLPKAVKRVVRVAEAVSVAELAKRMGVKASEVIKKLIELGVLATITQAIDYVTAAVVAESFGYEVENVAFEEEEAFGEEPVTAEGSVARPPVVTVMGHVDHGKTALLDAIRQTNVAALEAGGITQHIGAYAVSLERGRVVFLDTPGHEAFTAMRARGAKVTDIVVLVVAADDGVMPQTVEAINHAKAATVPIIVAVNKIDKPGSDPKRVRQALTEHGLVADEWGGDTMMVDVSAKKQVGLTDLLEAILLQAEVLDLKAHPARRALGTVIEAKLDKGRGPVATILVQNGTLRLGDPCVCGIYEGRVRAMFNDLGQRILEAPPSTPVEVLGLGGVPLAGDSFRVVADEKAAKTVAQHRQLKYRERELSRTTRMTLEELYQRVSTGEVRELPLVVKADVQGSVEALTDALATIGVETVRVRIIHSGVGAVTETDVMLARASNAIVIGFNVRPEGKVQDLAAREQVDVRLYTVIYDAVNDVKRALEGLLAPTLKEVAVGRAEVHQTFTIAKVGTVAGALVTEGKIVRSAKCRLVRDGTVVYQGAFASLRRFKDDVREVVSGLECGIGIENFQDIKIGDLIEAYEVEEVATKLA